MKITRFEDLECWQEARKLTNMVFALCDSTVLRGRFRLVDQMQGATVSVMNNIVEGFDSGSNAEFARFLGYARRSASEVQTCLYVTLDNRLSTQAQFDNIYQQAEKTRKVIDGFRRYLRTYQDGRDSIGQLANRRTGQRANGPTGQPANGPTGQRD